MAPERLELITGPMFSGKTSELIRRLERAERSGRTVLAAKPGVDPSPGVLVSHDGVRRPAVPFWTARDLAELSAGHDVVAVDEVQFLGDDLLPAIEQIVSPGVRVIVAGLDLDFRGVPFGSMPALRTRATTVTVLTASCALCGRAATRSQRLLDGRPAPGDAPIVVVGGAELYEPRCVACHAVAPAQVSERRYLPASRR